MCGGLAPQVDVVNASAFISNTKIHFQSSQNELESLQGAIPEAITAYEQLAAGANLNAKQIARFRP